MKTHYVEGQVHRKLQNGSYRVKVLIPSDDIAMFINGMIVFPPSESYPDWKVYTPKVFNARIVEFASSSPLWREIQDACIDAVKLDQSYTEKTEEGLYENIGKDNFGDEFRKQLNQVFPT